MGNSVTAVRLGSGYWKVFLPSSESLASAVVGFACVAITLNCLTAVSAGFDQSFALTADEESNRFLIRKAGARSESGSSLFYEEVHVGTEIKEIDLRSEEFLVMVRDVPLRREGTSGAFLIRGVSEKAFGLRPEIELSDGRLFEPGRAEAIVGEAAANTFEGLEIGDTFNHVSPLAGSISWKVVGHFRANGGIYESEAWVDLGASQSLYRG